jgi:hypothetical protein
MAQRIALVFFALLLATAAFGEITVAPAAPAPGEVFTIHLRNAFGSDGQVTSASIMQSGNTFTIQENVEIVCIPQPPPPPSALLNSAFFGSDFQVGPLPAGIYNVDATVNVTTCGRVPFTEHATVLVVNPIPALGKGGLAILASAVALIGMTLLKTRG